MAFASAPAALATSGGWQAFAPAADASDNAAKIVLTAAPAVPTTPERAVGLATTNFASSYGGEITNGDGSLTIFVTAAGRAGLAAALASNVGLDGYTIETVPHSWADLETLTSTIAADQSALATDGIDLTSWGPDPASNKVVITVSNYNSAAADALTTRFGTAWVTVAPQVGSLPVRTDDRFTDESPYFAADGIWFNNQPSGTICTNAFGYVAKINDKTYGLTAGHCGGDTVDTNLNSNREIGSVSTNYFIKTNRVSDFESFHCDCAANVWYQNDPNPAAYVVTGQCFSCGVNSLVTVDGAASGEVTDNTVQKYNYCQTFAGGSTSCNIVKTYKSGAVACQYGDSGGPAYQRQPNNTVVAAGVIMGAGDGGQNCYYTDIHDLMNIVGGTLLTG